MEKISASGCNISGKEVDYYDSGYIIQVRYVNYRKIQIRMILKEVFLF